MNLMPPRPLTATERQRRWRYRQMHALILARAEVPATLVEALIDAGLLPEEVSDDQRALGDALMSAASRFLNGAR